MKLRSKVHVIDFSSGTRDTVSAPAHIKKKTYYRYFSLMIIIRLSQRNKLSAFQITQSYEHKISAKIHYLDQCENYVSP